MEKILANIYVPALMKDFDLFIPQDVPIQRLVSVITGGIRELSIGRYAPSGKEMLIRNSDSQPMNPDKTLCEYGARDGESLILI